MWKSGLPWCKKPLRFFFNCFKPIVFLGSIVLTFCLTSLVRFIGSLNEEEPRVVRGNRASKTEDQMCVDTNATSKLLHRTPNKAQSTQQKLGVAFEVRERKNSCQGH